MSQTPKKRFIAGAICPQCQQQDKLMLLLDGASQRRECVACGFSDNLDALGKSDVPGTRFKGEPAPASSAAQVLTFKTLPGTGDDSK